MYESKTEKITPESNKYIKKNIDRLLYNINYKNLYKRKLKRIKNVISPYNE